MHLFSSAHSRLFTGERDISKNPRSTSMRRLPLFCGLMLTAAVLVIAAVPAQAGEIKGKVQSVDGNALTFVMENDGKMTDVKMDEDAKVIINDREASVADLRRGDQVVVNGRLDGGVLMAIEVKC